MSKNDTKGTGLSTELKSAEEIMAAAGQMVTKATSNTIQRAYGGMTIEQIVKVEEGQTITGIYRGLGPVVDVADPQDPNVMRPLQTFKIANIANPKVVALLLDSAQLGRFLRALPVGSKVSCTKLGQVAGRGGRRVNQWLLGHEPPPADVVDANVVS